MKYLTLLMPVLLLACSPGTEVKKKNMPNDYTEKHRPQYHFTPPTQWMNDPNGMVYYAGEYHLFYQYYPDSNVWGPMHWGHAVSSDMIRWDHLPIALYPDSLGLIFSGSAVIDWNNTSGFGEVGSPPMVAIFTHHLMKGEKEGRDDFQYQSIAYSLDKGRTWTKYEGNPVVTNPGIRDFRDPKVIWHEETEKWVMVFSARDRIKFYTSPDLKEWEFVSDFGPDQGSPGRPWECPDLFPMIADDGTKKWVLIVSVQSDAPNKGTGTSYFVGDFDGTNFTNDDPPAHINWLDYGTDNYAFVTWSDVPEEDGRRMGIGWMSNWLYAQIVPTQAWRSAMTLPRKLELARTDAGYRLLSPPVEELEMYVSDRREVGDSLFVIEAQLEGSFEIRVSNDINETVIIRADSEQLSVDRSNAGLKDFYDGFGAVHRAPLNGIVPQSIRVFVDASSVEVFMNDGALVMTELVFPNKPYTEVKVSGALSDTIRSIDSIWK